MALNFYDLLGVSPSATPDQIQHAYRQQMKQAHPDVVSAEEQAQAEEHAKHLNHAYAVLSDAGKRAVYDARLRQNQPPPAAPLTPYRGEYPSKRGIVVRQNTPPARPTAHDFAPTLHHSVKWWIAAFAVSLLLMSVLTYFAFASQQAHLPRIEPPTLTATP